MTPFAPVSYLLTMRGHSLETELIKEDQTKRTSNRWNGVLLALGLEPF